MKKVLLFLFISLIVSGSYAENFTGLMKKHRAGMEFWMLSGKINISSSSSIGIQIFVFSGKWLFISGNAVMISWLQRPAGKYESENKLMVPPFHKVSHNYEKLEENYSGNIIKYDEKNKNIYIETVFPDFKSKMIIFPVENIIPNISYKRSGREGSEAGGYSIADVKIEARIDAISASTLSGEGYYEHTWAAGMEEDHDVLYVKLNSGQTFKILYRHDKNNWQKELPDSFIQLFSPDGSVKKIKNFRINYTKWWKSEKTKRKYPVRTEIEIPEENINLLIEASTENQEISSMGMKLWVGFCDVAAELAGIKSPGWAVALPLGYK